MRRTALCWVGALTAAAVFVGCRPRQDVTIPAAPTAAPTAAAEPERAPAGRGRKGAAASPAVTTAVSPVQLLPDTTAVVFTAAGLPSVLALFDVDAIIGKYRTHYDQAASEVTRVAGVNLLDPTQWASVGLDVNGTMGAAMIDLRSETIVGFVSLTDREKFRTYVDTVSKGQFQPVLEDRGLVLKTDPDSNSAIVLRDRWAYFVSTDAPVRASYDHARSLATIDPARGLTSTPRWQRATASSEPARPLTAYVDLWALLEEELGQSMAREREPSWALQELERAQMSGAPQEELQRLRLQAEEERRWEEQRRQRDQLKYDVASRWFRSVEPLVFEFTASAAGVSGRVRARMPETSTWRAALRNAAEPSPVLTAIGERPMFLIGGNVDVLPFIGVLEDLIRADGDDPAKEYAEFKAETSVDLQSELAPIWTGSGGFALTVSEALVRGEYARQEQEMGFAAALGVNSPERALAIVQRAALKVKGAKVGKDRKTGATTLEIPNYRTVYAAVVAGQMVVTTDAGVIQRLASGGQTGLAKHLSPAAVPVVTARDAAAQGMFDLFYPVFLFMGRRHPMPDQAPEEPYMMFPEVPRAKIDAVPKSRAYKAKLREWTALDAKIRRDAEAEDRRQTKVVTAVADAIGVQAWHLRETPEGLVLEGGHFLGKGGLGRAIDMIADYAGSPKRSERTYEQHDRRRALEEELRRLRVVELAGALGVPAPGP